MQCEYENEARELSLRLKLPILIRDLNPVAKGLEVPRYHHCYTYYVSSVFLKPYSTLSSVGIHMLYTKEGENISAAVIVRHRIPDRFPRTWKYILSETKKKMEENGGYRKDITTSRVETKIAQNVYSNLLGISKNGLIEKTGFGKYRIPEEVRQNRLIPDCLPEDKQQEILRKFQARELTI